MSIEIDQRMLVAETQVRLARNSRARLRFRKLLDAEGKRGICWPENYAS